MTRFRGPSCAVFFFRISLGSAVPALAIHAQTPGTLSLMPMPQHISKGEGQLKIDGNFTVGLDGYKDARLESARKRFLNTLSRETGIPYHDEVTVARLRGFDEKLRRPIDAALKLGENESYHLEVTSDHMR